MQETISGTLIHGLKVGESLLKEFTLRQPTTGDLFRAEAMLPQQHGTLAFTGALLACICTKLGDTAGPLDLALIEKLHPADFHLLNDHRIRLEATGESK